MSTLYEENGLKILISFNNGYFEVFGLNCDDFEELRKFYSFLSESN